MTMRALSCLPSTPKDLLEAGVEVTTPTRSATSNKTTTGGLPAADKVAMGTAEAAAAADTFVVGSSSLPVK